MSGLTSTNFSALTHTQQTTVVATATTQQQNGSTKMSDTATLPFQPSAQTHTTNNLQQHSVSMNTTDTTKAELAALNALNAQQKTTTATTPTSAMIQTMHTLNLNASNTAVATQQQSSQSQSQTKSGVDSSSSVGTVQKPTNSGTASNTVQFDKSWTKVFDSLNFAPLKNHVSTIHHINTPDYIKMSLISFLPPNVTPQLKPIYNLQKDLVIGYELEFVVQHQNSSTPEVIRIKKQGGGFFFLEMPEKDKEVKILTYKNQEGNLCFYTYVEGRPRNWITYIVNEEHVYEIADITYPSRKTQAHFDKFWNTVFNTPNFAPLKSHVSTIHHVKAPDYIKMSLISFLPPNVDTGLKPIYNLQKDLVIGYELEFVVHNQNPTTELIRIKKQNGGFFFLETPKYKEVRILTYQNQEGNLCFYTYVEGRPCNWLTYILNDNYVYESVDITPPSRKTQSNFPNK